jgi:integral membrane sensor domain MASE1
MKNVVRFRFWLEMVMASCSAVLTLITFVWKDWIEIVFGFDPDNDTGSMEWIICSVLLIAAVTLFVLARYEWRRTQKEEYQYE